MATEVASLYADLNLRDNMTSQLNKASRSLSSFASSTQKTGKAITLGLAGAAAAGGAALAGMAAAGIHEFNKFERGMNEVFTLLPDISSHAMGQMENQAKSLAIEMGTLPGEVVPALYQAISAGVPQDSVFDFLEIASKASIGGVTSLETAVDGITSVVNAYGEDVIGAAEASDLMFTAVKLGKTDFDQLSRSLFNVIPTASGLGVGFENITAALATLTAQGTPTSVATTQLRQMLVELGDPATDVSEIFQEMAGSSFKDFIAEGGNVADALQVLEDYSTRTGVDIQNLFGSVEAGNAALGLTGTSAERFAVALEEMGTASGATEAAFQRMEESGARGFDKLKSVFNVILIDIGQRLSPVVNEFANIIMTMFRLFSGGLSDTRKWAQWVGDLPKPLQKAGKILANFGTIVNWVMSAFSKLRLGGDFFRYLRDEIDQTFRGDESRTRGPLAMVNAIEQLFNAVKAITTPIANFVRSFISAKDVLIAAGVAIASFLVPALLSIGAALAPIGLLIAGVAALRLAWENNFLGIQNIVQNFGDLLNSLIAAFNFGGLAGLGEMIFANLRNLGENALAAIQGIDWSGVGAAIEDGIAGAINILAWVTDNIATPLRDAIVDPNTWTTLQSQAGTILDSIFSFASPIAEEVYNRFLLPVATAILEKATDPATWESLIATAEHILTAIASGLLDLTQWVLGDVLSPIVNSIWQELTNPDAWETLINAAEHLLNAIASGLLDLTQWVLGDILSPIVNSIWQELTNQDNWATLIDVGERLLNAIALGLLDLTQWVLGDVLSPIVSSIGQELTNQDNWEALGDVAGTLLDTLAGGLSDIASWAINDVIIPIGGAIYDAAIEPANWAALAGMFIHALDAMANLAVNLRDWFVENVLGRLVSGAAEAANDETTWNPLNGLAKMALTALVHFALPLSEWVRQHMIAPLIANIQTLVTNPDTWTILGGLLVYALRSMANFIFDVGQWVYTNILFKIGQGIREKATDPQTWSTLGGLFIEALKAMAGFVVNLGEWLLEHVIGPVATAIVNLVTDPNTWTTVKDALFGLGEDIINWIGEGLAGLASALNDALVTPIESAVNDVFSNGGPLANTGVAGNRDRVSDFFEGRAGGGSVHGGSSYLVGERGPELFVPSRSGMIIPNHALAGGGGLNIGTLQVFANDVPALYDALERERERRAR